jgi:hypothetical protein
MAGRHGTVRNQPRCPSINDWIKKMWYKHTIEYCSAVKKKNYVICRKMDETRDHHVK